jgi:hypothetical protein
MLFVMLLSAVLMALLAALLVVPAGLLVAAPSPTPDGSGADCAQQQDPSETEKSLLHL